MKIPSFHYKQLLSTIEEALGAKAPERVRATLQLAIQGHDGQYRASAESTSRIPYIVHPVGVARLAIEFSDCLPEGTIELDDIICAALAHDLLEDTRVTAEYLEQIAGRAVRELVEALTKSPAHLSAGGHESRNAELADRIRKAGQTAIYLKTCDSMHNLMYPQSTPEPLLKKLVAKAERHYLPMMREAKLHKRLDDALHKLINEANSVLAGNARYSPRLEPPGSLTEALQQAALNSSSKLLELHDLVDILQSTSGCSNVVIWRQTKVASQLKLEISGSSINEDEISVPEGSGLLKTTQLLSNKLAKRFVGCRWVHDLTHVTTIPMQLDPHNRFVVAVEHIERRLPEWWSDGVAFVLVQFLAHRLILSASDRRSELALEAARCGGLQFDIDLAVALDIRATQLPAWNAWLSRCRQAADTTEASLRRLLHGGTPSSASQLLIRVSSRVKTCDSILRKMLSSKRYSWPNYDRLEDIAGVRVVVPTSELADQVEDHLVQHGKQEGIRLNSVIKQPRRDYVTNPTPTGYRAVHLILEVDTHLPGAGSAKVPCEVQIRTIFQDILAELTHATLYHASHTSRRKHKAHVEKLLFDFDHCQHLVEEFLLDFDSAD